MKTKAALERDILKVLSVAQVGVPQHAVFVCTCHLMGSCEITYFYNTFDDLVKRGYITEVKDKEDRFFYELNTLQKLAVEGE